MLVARRPTSLARDGRARNRHAGVRNERARTRAYML